MSSGNAVIRWLSLSMAAAEGVNGAAQELRKRLAAIDRASTFVASAQRRAGEGSAGPAP